MKPLPPAIARTLYALLPAGVNYLYSPSKTGLTIAHCLDYDLVCSGDDHKIAGSRLDHLVGAYIGRAFWRGDPALFAKALFGSKAAKHHWSEYYAKKPTPNGTLVVNISRPLAIPKSAAITDRDMGHNVVASDAACIGTPLPLVEITRLEAQ